MAGAGSRKREAEPSVAGSNLTLRAFLFPLPSLFPRFLVRCGNTTSRSDKSGASERARVISSVSISAVITAEIDTDEITRARSEAPLLSDLEVVLPHLTKNLGKREGRGNRKARKVRFDPATDGSASRFRLPAPAIHVVGRNVDEGDPLQIDAELIRRWLVSFLKEEVVLRRGFSKGIVGLSGGVDSALA